MPAPQYDPFNFNTDPYVKRVEKPWGYELHWVREGMPYMGKLEHINAGQRMSLQVHDAKQETYFIISGQGKLIWEDTKGTLIETELQPGQGYTTQIGQKHRLCGITDCDIIEVSTPEQGTTWRLEDDYARPDETPEQRTRERACYTTIMKQLTKPASLRPYLGALLGLSSLSTLTYLGQIWRTGSGHEWYLLWNLFLAWLPLLFATGLVQVLRHRSWASWQAVGLTVLWLSFLPNSFYIVTDFIHLPEQPHGNVLYAAVMFMAFALTGLVLGFHSLGLVHQQLRRRLPPAKTWAVLLAVLLLSSFAIYLGRDLRWNSWDLIFNPAGILFDVSDRIIDPYAHPQAFATTATFFVFLSGLYASAVAGLRALRR